MVVLEESIEVANVLVKLRSSEKGIVELRKRSGRDKGVSEGDGVKAETTKPGEEGENQSRKEDARAAEEDTETSATKEKEELPQTTDLSEEDEIDTDNKEKEKQDLDTRRG